MEKIIKRDKTENHITDALFELLKDRSLDDVTITDLTIKADVGRVTYYRHFKSLEEILTRYFEQLEKEFHRENPLPLIKTYKDYEDLAVAVLTFLYDRYDRIQIVFKNHLENLVLAYLTDSFNQKVSEDFKKHYPFAVPFVAGAVTNSLKVWALNNKGKADIPSVAESFCYLVFQKNRID